MLVHIFSLGYMAGDDAKHDVNQSQQIIRQLRTELEEVLIILKR